MRNALDRLYQSKLQLVAVVMTLGGLLVLALAESGDGGTRFADFPLVDLGSALLTTGLLAVAFEYLDRKDGDERATQRLRQVLREEAPAMRDAVIDGFAGSAEALKDVASPETIDRLVVNALTLRLEDQALAAGVYTDLRNQVIRASERWHDVRVSVALAPREHGPPSGLGAMFVATVHWEYRTTPASSVLRFACVSELDEYRELLRDQSITAVWYFEPIGDLQANSPEAFDLVQCSVDGTALSRRRTSRKGSQLHTVSLGREYQTDGKVTIAFTYRVLVQRAGHMLYLDIPRPSHGLQVQLWYGETDIRHVSALDFIASADQSRILRSPAAAPTPSIDIGFDGWVFPRSGVAFVWVLDSEVSITVPRRPGPG